MFQNITQHPRTSIAGLLIGTLTVAGVLSQQGITLGHAGTGTVVALIGALATALLGLVSRDPGTGPGSGGGAAVKVLIGFIAAHAMLWRFLFLFSLGVTMSLWLTGCAGMGFLTDLEAIVPTAFTGITGILAILAPLLGHSDPAIAALATTLQGLSKTVEADLGTLNALISEYKQTGDEGTLAEIEGLAGTVSSNLGQILQTNGLPAAEAAKVQAVVQALVAQFEALISSLPVLKASTAGQTLTVTKPVSASVFKAAVAHALTAAPADDHTPIVVTGEPI